MSPPRNRLSPEQRTQVTALWAAGFAVNGIDIEMGIGYAEAEYAVRALRLSRKDYPLPVELTTWQRTAQVHRGVHPDRSGAWSVGDALPAFHPLAMAILRAPQNFEVE